jgi:F0F1-type ATP synthase assembly protein I
MADDKRDSKNLQDTAIAWARYSEIAFIIPAAVVVGLLLGKLGDYFFHTHWLTITGIIFGAIVGFVQLIRTVLRDKS